LSDASNAALLAQGREVLNEQPFSRLLGTQLNVWAPGRAELELVLRTELLQQNGFAHGGVVSYLADNALTFAGGTAMHEPVVTAEYKINYVRPAIGDRLVARARAVHVSQSQAVCQCEVFAVTGSDEKLCAIAQGTIARASEKNGPS
jgi:uncharacterized protein (TIGR00369 family)